MDARAKANFVLISPRKARLSADLIKNKPVNEALAILKYTPEEGRPDDLEGAARPR